MMSLQLINVILPSLAWVRWRPRSLRGLTWYDIRASNPGLSKCEDFEICTDVIFMVVFYGELVVFIGLSNYSYRKNEGKFR